MIGSRLAHYEIIASIGRGGMGEVYRARDLRLDRDVALKVLPPEASGDPGRRRRFEREAKAVAALKHPNIVTIFSVEESDGVQFLTMELVEGRTLSELIPEGGLPQERFLEIAVPLADALSHAHAHGITHRDLKPANIMLDGEGRLKVLDFGLAALWAPASSDPDEAATVDARLTEAGHVLGTPPYMSPEQVAGGVVDGRSDLFSVGTIFHELLSGARPFTGDYPAAVMHAVVRDDPPPLTTVPGALASIVTRCLRKNPDERFADAGELLDALRGIAGAPGAGVSPPPAEVSREAREAFEQSDWHAVIHELEGVAERRPLSPGELEMLSVCCSWVSEWDEAVRVAEKAFAMYSERGRDVDAARVALWLVAMHTERNATALTRGWLRKAERLLADRPESVEHGYLMRRHTVEAMNACDFDRALECNGKCAALAERLGDRDLITVALHDRGQILVRRGDVEEGTALVDEAMAAAVGGAVSQATLGLLYCRTLTVCRSIADFDRAREWTEAAWGWCQPHGTSSFPGICRVHSAETMRHRGRWTEAEKAVRAACDFFDRVGPASHAGEALNELGELLLRKGDYGEAEEAFRRAHAYGHDPVPGLPLLRLAQGNGDAARQIIERALDERPEDRLLRARLLSAAVLIALSGGDPARAERAVEELAAISKDYRCPAFRGQAAMGRGALELARGDHAAAVPALREAWSTFHEAGFPYEAARARVLLARAYTAAGNAEDARLQLDAARKTFTDLGARPDLDAVTALLGETG